MTEDRQHADRVSRTPRHAREVDSFLAGIASELKRSLSCVSIGVPAESAIGWGCETRADCVHARVARVARRVSRVGSHDAYSDHAGRCTDAENHPRSGLRPACRLSRA